MTVEILVPMFLRKMVTKAIRAFDDIVYGTREIIRMGRNMVRKKSPKKPYSMNY